MKNRLDGVSVKSIVCSVPQGKDIINESSRSKEDIEKFIAVTGVIEKRTSNHNYTTLDLCEYSFNHIISQLNWEKESVDILVFVSQTPDYSVPPSSVVLQGRLNLGKRTVCIDISRGCTGWVEGLVYVSGLMKSLYLQKGILLSGETNILSDKDLDNNFYLMGDAGSATALELDDNGTISFDILNNGKMFDAIFAPKSGARYISSLSEGNTTKTSSLSSMVSLNGHSVFEFVLKEVVPQIKNFIISNAIEKEIDSILLHQASKIINEYIEKSISLQYVSFPKSLSYFGNTSSASIPLTICSNTDKVDFKRKNVLCCAFGVGMSSAIVYFKFNESVIFSLIEI